MADVFVGSATFPDFDNMNLARLRVKFSLPDFSSDILGFLNNNMHTKCIQEMVFKANNNNKKHICVLIL